LEFKRVIGKIIQRLQDHDFEHDHRIKQLSGRFGFAILCFTNSFNRFAEKLPVDDLIEIFLF